MPDMVQNAVERVRELLAQLRRDRDAAELIILRAEVNRLKEAQWEHCPVCPDQGWYADIQPQTGDPVQVQCEFCWTNPKSYFINTPQEAICDITEAKDDQLQKAS